MNDFVEHIVSFLSQQKTCVEQILDKKKIISEIVNILIQAHHKGSTIYTVGNGGSSSTASHFVSDLLKTAILKDNKRFRAICLADNVPVMLAWGNDSSYENIFIEQLKNFLKPEDIIIAFSGSGNSPNVIKSLEYAKENGALCIGFTGMSGGQFPNICDICFIVPSDDMLTIESIHLMICHSIISAIRSTGEPVFKYD